MISEKALIWLENLKKDNERKAEEIRQLQNNQLTGNFKGSNITLSDSAEAFCREIALRNVLSQETKCYDVTVENQNFFKENEVSDIWITGAGDTGASSITKTTGFMPIKANQNYYFTYDYETLANSNTREFCIFNKEKNPITNAGNYYDVTSKKLIVNSNQDGFVRIAFDVNITNIMFSKNPNVSYSIHKGQIYPIDTINRNHFNKEDVKVGYYNTNGDVQIYSQNWGYSEIPCEPEETYYMSGNRYSNQIACIVLLDENKSFIKTIGSYSETKKIETTEKTAFIGISVPINPDYSDLDTLMISPSDVSEYVPYTESYDYPLYGENDYYYKENDTWYVYNENSNTETKITNQVFIEQLENFSNAKTYKGETNISINSKDVEAEGIYIKDIESVINNMQELILEGGISNE